MATGAEFDVRGDRMGAVNTLRDVLESGFPSVPDTSLKPAGACPDIFTEYTQIPIFDNAIKSPRDEAVAEVCVTPVNWLRLQMAAAESFVGEPRDPEEWLSEPLVLRQENTRELAGVLQRGGGDVPKPVLELDRDGRITGYQEGRNRGVAAYYAGYDRIPVWVVLDGTETGGSDVLLPPSKSRVRGILEDYREEVMGGG